MKKSLSTRFKITKTGKVIRRSMAQCHFRAKKTSKQVRQLGGYSIAARSISEKIMKKPGAL